MELAAKIQLLRASGVKKFKDGDIEIEFEAVQLPEPPAAEPQFPPGMPPELKNPDLMKLDNIRDWSATPSPGDDEELVGTGDAPL